jgi:DNA-directed RNA polymerase specialized sigma24 family protein
VSGEHGGDLLRVEAWELDLATRIAGSYRPGDQDLRAELFKRLIEIKANRRSTIRNWQAYLAQSLYNAAKNFFRREDALRRRAGFSSTDDAPDDYGLPDRGRELIAPEDPIETRLYLDKIWRDLIPEMRELAQLLLEEEGNASLVAKRLGRSRKTVEYWIRKLRTILKKNDLG